MKRCFFILIFASMLLIGTSVNAQPDTSLVMSENQTYTIQNITQTLDGFDISGNSCLVIRDSHVTMLESSYSIREEAKLVITNSTLEWQGQGGIRMKDKSSAEVHNSTIYMRYEVANRTYYGHVIGLSEYAVVRIEETKIGYIKLSDSAKCSIKESIVGEFGTNSVEPCTVTDSEIQSLILIYEDTWIHYNGSIAGKVNWTSDRIVKNGNSSHPLILENVELNSPPTFQLVNCNFEANNTEVDLILIGGNSGVTIQGVNVTLLYLIEDVWANVKQSNLEILRCRNGDFNVKVSDSDIAICESMMTTGFNLKIDDTEIGKLNLMYAHPEAPNNVEIHNCCIKKLYLNPSAPPAFLFEDAKILEGVVLESGEGEASIPLLSGELLFGENCTIEHDEREGVSEVIRVFKVEVTSENKTTSGLTYTLVNGNRTINSGTTGENGVIVFPIKFTRSYSLIEDPQLGGPYLTDLNNFTSPLKLIVENQETTIGFTSNTPITIKLEPKGTQTPEIETGLPVTPVSVIVRLVIGTALFIIRRKDRPQPEELNETPV